MSDAEEDGFNNPITADDLKLLRQRQGQAKTIAATPVGEPKTLTREEGDVAEATGETRQTFLQGGGGRSGGRC